MSCYITMEEAAENVTFSMIEQYVATELNFRLKDFDPDIKINEPERIREKLDRVLSDDERKSIGANYKMAGKEYAEAIARHFISDNPNAKINTIEGLGEIYIRNTNMSQVSQEIKQEAVKEKSR